MRVTARKRNRRSGNSWLWQRESQRSRARQRGCYQSAPLPAFCLHRRLSPFTAAFHARGDAVVRRATNCLQAGLNPIRNQAESVMLPAASFRNRSITPFAAEGR